MIGNKSPTQPLQPPPTPSEPTVTDRREVKEGRSPIQPPRKGRGVPPQAPPKGGDVQVRKYFAENYQIKSPALIPRVRIGTPLPSEGSGEAVGAGGGFCISLCKTDSYKGICGTCYSSTPKNDCFLNKVAYLCKQRTETRQQPVPTSPRGEERR